MPKLRNTILKVLCSLVLLSLTVLVPMVSASTVNDYCTARYQYNALMTTFAHGFAVSDKSVRERMLKNSEPFALEIVKMHENDVFGDRGSDELEVLDTFSDLVRQRNSTFNSQFRYFQWKSDVENLIVLFGDNSQWDYVVRELNDNGYFDNLSNGEKIGLQTLIAHNGVEALRYHPWLAIPADDEELLEAQGSCFFHGVKRLAISLDIDIPTVSNFAYEPNGQLQLELNGKSHTVLDSTEFGDEASFHVGVNILSVFNGWLDESSRKELLYSMGEWNDHTAIVLTVEQISIIENAAKLADSEFPKVR